jgi:hypothetical protein
MKLATVVSAVVRDRLRPRRQGKDVPDSDRRQHLNPSDFRISSALHQGFDAVDAVGTLIPEGFTGA